MKYNINAVVKRIERVFNKRFENLNESELYKLLGELRGDIHHINESIEWWKSNIIYEKDKDDIDSKKKIKIYRDNIEEYKPHLSFLKEQLNNLIDLIKKFRVVQDKKNKVADNEYKQKQKILKEMTSNVQVFELDKVKDILQPSIYHLFISKELVASEKTPKLLRQYVKENFEQPKKPLKGYIVRMKIDKNEEHIISINVDQVTINEKLNMERLEEDGYQTLTFTKDELKKYGFKMDYLYKLFDDIKNDNVRYDKSIITITKLLNLDKIDKEDKPKVDDIDDLLDKVKDTLQPSINHLFVDNELVASSKLIKNLEKDIKDNFEPPKKPLKGYLVRMKIDKNFKYIISINVDKMTINENLIMYSTEFDFFQTFTYTKDELKKYGFKMDYIYKMIYFVKNNIIKFNRQFISITELLNLVKNV